MTDDPILKAHYTARAQAQANLISRRLQTLAKKIDKELRQLQLPGEPRPLFGLFVFTGGAAQYVGTGEREDIKRVVASVMARWEDPEYATLHKPHHEKTADEHQQERDKPL